VDERRGQVRRSDDAWSLWDKRVRDSVIFLVGVLGVIHELFIVSDPRIAALVFLGSLIGVPFVLSADERRDRGTDG
jgi:hypothetical protein